MNVLVTGATGFIGSHLCRELLGRGHRVLGLSHSGKTDYIQPLLSQREFRLVTGDIRDSAMLRSLVKDNAIETVFHLAARLPGDETLAAPTLSFDINAGGTMNLLSAACSSGVTSFVYASTIDVYSTPPHRLPVDEDHPTRPSTIYGMTKLAGELAGELYAESMNITALRYSVTYGRGGRSTNAIPAFFNQALTNKPITIHGSGEQTADFVYIGDVVRATLLALETGKPGIYNIGSGEETSVLELARKIIAISGSRSKISMTEKPAERPFRFRLDINRARKALNYKPRSLDEGLAAYLADLKGGGGQ